MRELIHVNLGLAKFPLQSKEMASFWALEKPIYDKAREGAGFIREIKFLDRFSVFPEPHVFNASAWRTLEDLKTFVYSSLHADALKDRKRWFTESEYPKYVLFWSEPGVEHSENSCAEKLLHYQKYGATEAAFDFKNSF